MIKRWMRLSGVAMFLLAARMHGADNFVRGFEFDGTTGLKSGADLEDLVTLATFAAAAAATNNSTRLLDGVTLVVNSNSVVTGSGLPGNATGNLVAQINTNSIKSAHIEDLTITGADIANGTITTGKLDAAVIALLGSSAKQYVYIRTGTFDILSVTNGGLTFIAGTQSISRLHAGLSVTGSVFAANTTISSVNYDTYTCTISAAATQTASNATGTLYSATGSFSHITPSFSSGSARCKVIVTGGGGGGAFANGGGYDQTGQGGAGATAIGYYSFAAGTSNAVTVGARGVSVPTDDNGYGSNATSSAFGTLLTATGGTGGEVDGSNTGGTGGTAYGGTFNIDGTDGKDAQADSAGNLLLIVAPSYWGTSYGCGAAGGTSQDPSEHGIVFVEYY